MPNKYTHHQEHTQNRLTVAVSHASIQDAHLVQRQPMRSFPSLIMYDVFAIEETRSSPAGYRLSCLFPAVASSANQADLRHSCATDFISFRHAGACSNLNFRTCCFPGRACCDMQDLKGCHCDSGHILPYINRQVPDAAALAQQAVAISALTIHIAQRIMASSQGCIRSGTPGCS